MQAEKTNDAPAHERGFPNVEEAERYARQYLSQLGCHWFMVSITPELEPVKLPPPALLEDEETQP